MAAEVTAEVDRAVAAAEAAPLEPVEDLDPVRVHGDGGVR